MPLVVALFAQKGGAGKTTLAVTLADAFMVAGHRVVLVDADPQGSARVWADVAAERGAPCPTVIGSTGPTLRQTVQTLAPTADVIVIDTPPRMAAEARAAAAVAHVVLVPVSPGPADVWALSQAVATLDEVQAVRPDLVVRLVANRLNRRTSIGATLVDSATSCGLSALKASVGDRVAFAEAMGDGQGVVSHAPTSTAAKEARALAAEVLGLVDGSATKTARKTTATKKKGKR